MGTMTREQFMEEFGTTPERMALEMQQFRASTTFFVQHEAELRRTYTNNWIAIHDGKFVASAETHDELLGELEKKDIPSNHSFIQYLPLEEPTLILPCR